MKQRPTVQGQSLVEFSLLIGFAVFLLTGFFDLGRAIFYYSSLSNAVREGARSGIVDKCPTCGPYLQVVRRINDYSFSLPDVGETPTNTSCFPGPCTYVGPEMTIKVTRIKDSSNTFYETVKVEGSYYFKPITPGIKQIFGSAEGIALNAQSTMRIAAASR